MDESRTDNSEDRFEGENDGCHCGVRSIHTLTDDLQGVGDAAGADAEIYERGKRRPYLSEVYRCVEDEGQDCVEDKGDKELHAGESDSVAARGEFVDGYGTYLTLQIFSHWRHQHLVQPQ